MSTGQTANFTWIQGSNDTATVYGKTDGGKTVKVYLPSSVIEGIAKYLDCNHGQVGHAIWHYENPESQYPCSTCSQPEGRKQ